MGHNWSVWNNYYYLSLKREGGLLMQKDARKDEKETKEEEREGVSHQFIEKIIALQEAESQTK